MKNPRQLISSCLRGGLIVLSIVVLLTPMISLAQDKGAAAETKLPPAAPLLSPAICGKGVFQLLLGDESVGREEFEIKCQPDGNYMASGHTQLKVPGASSDLNTTLEVDRAGDPLSATAKGTVGDKPFDQSLVVKGTTATITTNGSVKEFPFPKGLSFLGGNIFYMFQFALARYNPAQAGVQQLAIFPNASLKVERSARDEVRAADLSTAAAAGMFDRYRLTVGLTELILWVDEKGRIAVAAVPLQNFAAVREEYANLIPSFKAILSAKMKEPEVDYSAPPAAPFTAEEVTVDAKGFTLAGTLLLPKEGKRPLPAVITITGSGQQTRDEYLPLPGLEKYRPFRQIAEALAARGIAVLRVDDRGVGKSKGRETLDKSTSADFADDVRAEIEYLRRRGDIDPARIALVGHSEGGMIAPMIAASDPHIAAIVLLAGPGKRGDAIIAYQANQGVDNDDTLTEEVKAKKRAETQESLRKIVEGNESAATPAIMRSAWMKYFLTYDPLLTVRKVRQPILILQGALDRQVTADQADMIERAAREAGNKDVTKRVYADLNHLFLPAKTGSPSEYSSLGTNTIGDDVMSVLGDWLGQKLKVKK
ncbi:MAG TPA: alpha/beta fold hydrolase [Blastocatellia bacterium]|nr:alpha/beta fold hydrolase [Blastocatellia bacterium]